MSEAGPSSSGGTPVSPRKLFGRGRVSSNPTSTRPGEGVVGPGGGVELDTVLEEERISQPSSPHRPALGLQTNGTGLETSGRRGSFEEWSHSTRSPERILSHVEYEPSGPDAKSHHARLASPPPSRTSLAEDENAEEEHGQAQDVSQSLQIDSRRGKEALVDTRRRPSDDMPPVRYHNSLSILGFDASKGSDR